MLERVDARGRDVGIVRQIAGGVEPGVRIAPLVPAEAVEVSERVDARRRHVRIVQQVVLGIEAGDDLVADRRKGLAAFGEADRQKVRSGSTPAAATSGLCSR